MILILVIGIVFVGVTAGLVARAFVLPRVRAAERVGHISTYGFEATLPRPAAAVDDTRRPLTTLLSTFAGALGNRFSGLPGASEQDLRRLLLAAGLYTVSPAKIVGYQLVAAVGLPLLWLWLGVSGGASGVVIFLGMVVLLVAGWVGPLAILKRRGRQRLDQIDYEMPELIDPLVTTVEAGVAFAASLQIASQRFRGPLAAELRLMLQEQSMGLSLNGALQHLLERADTPAVRSFVRAIIQGELLGVSVGDTLRGLATEMRKRRRQRAEERAQKAPIKILFPLVFLIFPAMFIILLGPAVFKLHDLFNS
jgi:tight adherence protein C